MRSPPDAHAPEAPDELARLRARVAELESARAANAALGQSEERYRGLVELAPVGIAIHAAGKVVFINETGARILGAASPAEFVGTPVIEMVYSEDRPIAAERISRVIALREATPITSMRFARRDGTPIFVDIAGAPVTHEGQPASQFVFTDVGERRRAELELAKLRMAVQTSGEVVFLTDREGLITYVNPEFSRVYGWAADEVVGRATPRVLKSGTMSLEQIEGFWRAILGKQVVRAEYANRTKDGRMIQIAGSASPIIDDGGEILGFLAVQRDVTERKRHEERLRLTQYSVDHAGDAVFWVRPSGHILYVNEHACRQLGYSREELLGMAVGSLDPAFGPDAWDAHWQDIKAHRSVRVDTVHVAKDGRHIPVEICVNYVDFDGEEYALAFSRDVTVQKDLAAQFQHAQKMEAVGRLAGGVAHDFNNLLSVILTYTDIALDELKHSDPLRADVEEIKRAAERAAGVARQLLVFSRRDLPNPSVIDVNDVLADLEKLLRRLIGEDVQLVTVPTVDVWPVKIDPGHLEQILVNLAVNSRDAMPSGGQLVITTSNVVIDDGALGRSTGLATGRYVQLEVRDTGSGMTADVAARAFDPFFTTKPKGQGTGLGLSMVYGIVKALGGAVTLNTTPGRGTAFSIYLKAREGAVASTREAVAPTAIGGDGETILVVEDEDAVRTLVARILLRGGYRVHQAANAGEALLVCERVNERVDLLLTDVVMPQMSGTELAARLAIARPGLPVLYMSGYTDNALVHDGVLDEGVRLLQKPFTRETLLASVSAALSGARAAT